MPVQNVLFRDAERHVLEAETRRFGGQNGAFRNPLASKALRREAGMAFF